MDRKKENSLTKKAEQEINAEVKLVKVFAEETIYHLNQMIEHGNSRYLQFIQILKRDLKKAIGDVIKRGFSATLNGISKETYSELEKLYRILEEIEKKELQRDTRDTEIVKKHNKELEKIYPI